MGIFADACSYVMTAPLFTAGRPWQQLNANFTNSKTMTWPGFDNPTVTFFPNGSLLGLSRGGDLKRESSSDGVVTAPSWKGECRGSGGLFHTFFFFPFPFPFPFPVSFSLSPFFFLFIVGVNHLFGTYNSKYSRLAADALV